MQGARHGTRSWDLGVTPWTEGRCSTPEPPGGPRMSVFNGIRVHSCGRGYFLLTFLVLRCEDCCPLLSEAGNVLPTGVSTCPPTSPDIKPYALAEEHCGGASRPLSPWPFPCQLRGQCGQAGAFTRPRVCETHVRETWDDVCTCEV